MQLHAYLIKNQVPHVINGHMHQVATILSGKMYSDEVELRVARGSAQF